MDLAKVLRMSGNATEAEQAGTVLLTVSDRVPRRREPCPNRVPRFFRFRRLQRNPAAVTG
jgi:hypothetical protein